jgi:hypothetical protein
MEEQTPLQELEALFPELEDKLYLADFDHIKDAYRIATGEDQLPDVFKTLKARIDVTVEYLGAIANSPACYKGKPKGQELLRKAVGILKRIE